MSNYPRPVALRRTVGSLSAGTRVDVVEEDDDGFYVQRPQNGEIFHVEADDLVTLRERTKPDLKKQRQLRIQRVIGK
jgi:hypothetical protein